MNYVIIPLSKEKLLNLIDDKSVEVIKYFIKKSLFSQPEVVDLSQVVREIQIPKEHIEQWFVQALGGSPIGSGSYPIDVFNTEGSWGADIKMLNATVDKNDNLTNTQSGEASLAQKFKGIGSYLDELFKNRDYEIIKDGWLDIFASKIEQVKNDIPVIKDIYYIFLLRANNSFYVVGAEVKEEYISDVSVLSATNDSVFLAGFIDERYGKTKIYKARKRLELRLRPKNWIDDNLFVCFDTDYASDPINLRNVDIDDDFLRNRFKSIEDIKINFR